MQRIGIKLDSTKTVSNNSTVKNIALATFKFMRASSKRVAKVPGVVQQAVTDISEAWQETAGAQHPKF
jgi:hypothetical protein